MTVSKIKAFFENAASDTCLMQSLVNNPVDTLRNHGIVIDQVPEEILTQLASLVIGGTTWSWVDTGSDTAETSADLAAL